jgi:hypothetical protein
MKTILFITSDSTYRSFNYVIEELGEEYKCFVVDSLTKALKVLEGGVDQVVMYPFYIKYYDYYLNTNQDPRLFAGYQFWKQELANKNIPIIVVNLNVQDAIIMPQLIEKNWENEANVLFFNHNEGYKSSVALAKLIRS